MCLEDFSASQNKVLCLLDLEFLQSTEPGMGLRPVAISFLVFLIAKFCSMASQLDTGSPTDPRGRSKMAGSVQLTSNG